MERTQTILKQNVLSWYGLAIWNINQNQSPLSKTTSLSISGDHAKSQYHTPFKLQIHVAWTIASSLPITAFCCRNYSRLRLWKIPPSSANLSGGSKISFALPMQECDLEESSRVVMSRQLTWVYEKRKSRFSSRVFCISRSEGDDGWRLKVMTLGEGQC